MSLGVSGVLINNNKLYYTEECKYLCHMQLYIQRYFHFHLYCLHIWHGRLFLGRIPYVLSVEIDILHVTDVEVLLNVVFPFTNNFFVCY